MIAYQRYNCVKVNTIKFEISFSNFLDNHKNQFFVTFSNLSLQNVSVWLWMNSVLHPCGFFSLMELNETKPVLQYCKCSIFSQICLVQCTFVIPLKKLLFGLTSDKIKCKFCVQEVQIHVSFDLETMTNKFKRWFWKSWTVYWHS